jgi:hypothetical protein
MRKPEEKRPCGIPGYRWEDNSKMDLDEIGWEEFGLILLRMGTSGRLL